MGFTGDYNLAAVQCTIGTFRVTGWAPDDAISLSPVSDLWESEASADGSHISRSRINDPRWDGVLKVRRGTAAYRLLMEEVQAQITAAETGAVPALAFQVYDPISGDKIVESNLLFKRYPDLPFSKSASDAEFAVELSKPTITAGANISTSV